MVGEALLAPPQGEPSQFTYYISAMKYKPTERER